MSTLLLFAAMLAASDDAKNTRTWHLTLPMTKTVTKSVRVLVGYKTTQGTPGGSSAKGPSIISQQPVFATRKIKQPVDYQEQTDWRGTLIAFSRGKVTLRYAGGSSDLKHSKVKYEAGRDYTFVFKQLSPADADFIRQALPDAWAAFRPEKKSP